MHVAATGRPSRQSFSRRKIQHALAQSLDHLEPRVLLSIVTDYSNVPQTPHPALPAKYASYTDPDFGTKVIRLTDATDGNDNHNAYSYWPSFNKDNTRIMIWKSTRAELYSFDPTTMAISDLGALFVGPAPDGSTLDWQDAIWSANDPSTIYAHANTGSKIYAYNVNTHVYTLVHNFATDAGWAANDYIAQISKSMDDNVFAFTRKQYGTWAVLGWEAYKVSTNSAVKFVTNSNIDEVQVDKSGAWVVEKYADSSGDNVWNLSTGTATWLVDGSPDYSPDHSDMGSGIIVSAENWQNRTLQRSLAAPHSFTTIFTPPPANEGGALWQDGHISMLMDGDQWAMKSLEYTGTKTGPFLREIFLVATDGSGRVIRFAHNYTVNVANYWHNSFGNISRDGRFAITTSDMGDPNRTDVYIVRVPIPGDANLDYIVDQTDWNIWNANNGGTNKTWAQGDWDADHDVDNADLALWTANQTGGGGTPTVTISATDATASETLPNNGVWTVTRTGATTAALTVNFTKSGTATNGTDYNSIGTSVTIPIGASSATITLTPINDSTVEGDETAIITLATGTGYTIGSPSAGTVTLLDNDVPTVTISATDATASETLPNNGVWTVTRTGPTTAALVVNFTKSGTATNGTDYNSIGTTVTIPIGSASATITLTPVDDALVEGSETAIITLASGSGYTVGSPSAGTVTITDNDSGGSGPAYDGYGYTVGGGANWNGQNGGTGWGGAWTVTTPADASVLSGSLTYSTLSTSGNKVTLWHQDTANRNTSLSYGTDGTSRWVGVLMNSSFSGGTNPNLGGEIDLGTQLKIGTVWNAPVALRTNIGGSESFAQSTFTPTAGGTYFAVAP